MSKISKILLSLLTLVVMCTASVNTNTIDVYAIEQNKNEASIKDNIHKKAMVSVEEVKFERVVNIEIPTNTYCKTYEDGRLITDTTSQAYTWISKCHYDERGHYMLDNKYHAVAMGNYFAEVGTKFKISLDTGKIIYVVKCDVKQDQHTTNRMIDGSGAMIEFIINSDIAANYYGLNQNGYVLGGSFNNHESFRGNIIKIEQIIE